MKRPNSFNYKSPTDPLAEFEGEGLIMHIGLPKCGSTWLQKRFFKEEEGFFSVKEKIYRKKFLTTILPDDTPYFEGKTGRQEFVKALIRPALEAGKVPLISHERLAGTILFGSYDRELIAQRLQSIFPKSRIIIIVREQKDLIYSWYKQYVKAGGTLKLKRFLNQKWSGPYLPHFNLKQFDYVELVSLYQKLFGEKNVLFLPYELLKMDPEDFLKRIKVFSGMEALINSRLWEETVNPSPSASNIEFRRRMNHIIYDRVGLFNQGAFFYKSKTRKLWSYWRLPYFLDRRIDRKCRADIAHYAQSSFEECNAQLQNMTDINLKHLGY